MQVLPWALLLIVTARGRRSLLEATLFAALPSLVMALVVLRGRGHQAAGCGAQGRHDAGAWGEQERQRSQFPGLLHGSGDEERLVLGNAVAADNGAHGPGGLRPAAAARLSARRHRSGAHLPHPRRRRMPGAAQHRPSSFSFLATGFDWLRWFATWACLWTLTGALIVLRGDEKALAPSAIQGRSHTAAVSCSLVLLALTAIPAGPAVGRRECGYIADRYADE